MKRILLCLTLALGLCKVLHADDAPAAQPPAPGTGVSLAVDPKTPNAIQRIASTYHVLDNLTPLTFFDAHNGVWCAGGVTTLYKQYYVSADAGLAAPMVQSTKGEFAGGFRFYPGELALDKINGLRHFVDANGLTAGFLKYAAAGVMVSYDWSPIADQKPWRYGPYVGFEIHIQ